MVSNNERERLLNNIEALVKDVGDNIPGDDRPFYREHVKGILSDFLIAVINNQDNTSNLDRNITALRTELDQLKKDLKGVQDKVAVLNQLSDEQQGVLGLIVKASKAQAEAQTAKEQALEFEEEAKAAANKAEIAAPDTISIQTILNRVDKVHEARTNVDNLAAEAIRLAGLAIRKLEESQNNESTPGERSPEELVQLARENADKAIKSKDEVKNLAEEVVKLAEQTTQEHDNWSVVKSLFSISE